MFTGSGVSQLLSHVSDSNSETQTSQIFVCIAVFIFFDSAFECCTFDLWINCANRTILRTCSWCNSSWYLTGITENDLSSIQKTQLLELIGSVLLCRGVIGSVTCVLHIQVFGINTGGLFSARREWKFWNFCSLFKTCWWIFLLGAASSLVTSCG